MGRKKKSKKRGLISGHRAAGLVCRHYLPFALAKVRMTGPGAEREMLMLNGAWPSVRFMLSTPAPVNSPSIAGPKETLERASPAKVSSSAETS